MRVVVTAAAYLVSVAVFAPALFFIVILLAGPHSSMLPSMVQPAVVLVALAMLVTVPALIARGVWRRLSRGAEEK